MFERFTDEARRVVVLAQEEARALGHDYIGSEHLLLGLASEDESIAAKALESLNISVDAIRSGVVGIVGSGGANVSGHVPFTPRAKKILEMSWPEAVELDHRRVGPEHILLALIREGNGVGAQALEQLGVSLHSVRDAVVSMLGGESPNIGEEPTTPQAHPLAGWTSNARPNWSSSATLPGAWRRVSSRDELPDLRNAELLGLNAEWPGGQLVMTVRSSPEASLRITVYGVSALSFPRAEPIVPSGTIKEATLGDNGGLIELTIKMKNRDSFTVCGESFDVETFGWT